MKADVILPAAGTSERMNLPIAKQFLTVLGKHILAYTVDVFHTLPWVRHVIVVVNQDQIEFTKKLMENYGFCRVRVCAGSHSRHRSIFCGLQALKSECSDCDVVIVHDAARPLVSEQVARQVVEAAVIHGAAGVTRPLVSTVICGDVESRLVESLDRRFYRNSEMPQAFHFGVITSAYEQCSEDDLDHGTECLLLALKYSKCPAALVEGTDDLWKVTYQKDVYSLESVLKEKWIVVSVINSCSQEILALEELHRKLSQRQVKITSQIDCPANTFVVVWDWQLDQTLEDVTNRICRLYKQDMPSSAVKLDLMVVIVFLHDCLHMVTQAVSDKSLSTQSTHDCNLPASDRIVPPDMCEVTPSRSPADVIALCCGDAAYQSSETDKSIIDAGVTRYQSSGTDKSIIDAGVTRYQSSGTDKSIIDAGVTRYQSSGTDKSIIDAGVTRYQSSGTDKSIIDAGVTRYQSSGTDKSIIDAGVTRYQSSGTDKSIIDAGVTRHPSHHVQDSPLSSSLDHHGNNINISVDSTLSAAPISQRCSTVVHSQTGELGSNFIKYVTAKLPNATSCSNRQKKEGSLSCTAVVRQMKVELVRDIGKFVLTVGVSCNRRSPISEQLAELIWQRSLCVDGQVLAFDDCQA